MPRGTPTSTAQRVAASQARMAERGGARMTLLLSADAAAALGRIIERDGGTRTAAIERAVIAAACGKNGCGA